MNNLEKAALPDFGCCRVHSRIKCNMMKVNMNIVVEMKFGAQLYGTATPDSDMITEGFFCLQKKVEKQPGNHWGIAPYEDSPFPGFLPSTTGF